jgi:hypothetical protein
MALHQRLDLLGRPLLTFLPLVRIEEVIPLGSIRGEDIGTFTALADYCR